MTYRLKDTKLQKKLDELSDGDFSRQLEVNKGHIIMGIEYSEQATVWFCKPEGPLLSIEITPDMLERVGEYDPYKWNKYPDVEPPEGILMRVECHGGMKTCAKYRLFAEGGSWCDLEGVAWPDAYSERVIRFRPWDDDEEDEE